MVRLLRSVPRPKNGNVPVSIPQWCDCCLEFRIMPYAENFRFNPTMVRLLHFALQGSFLTALQFQSHNGAIAAPS